MKNAFYVTLKALFILLNFCPYFFGYVEKRLDKKAKVNFKIYSVKSWETNNSNPHVAQYLNKQRRSDNEI